MFTDYINVKETIKLVEEYTDNNFAMIGYTLLGGEISKKSSKDTAFYPRKKKFFTDIAAFWNSPSIYTENWCNNVTHILSSSSVYVYVGFPLTPTFNDKVDPSIYYGRNTKRLIEIKNKYDPLNILSASGTL